MNPSCSSSLLRVSCFLSELLNARVVLAGNTGVHVLDMNSSEIVRYCEDSRTEMERNAASRGGSQSLPFTARYEMFSQTLMKLE